MTAGPMVETWMQSSGWQRSPGFLWARFESFYVKEVGHCIHLVTKGTYKFGSFTEIEKFVKFYG